MRVDSDIAEAIDAAAPISQFVQLSDWVHGERELPNRAILGDGMIPLEWLLTRMIRAGFKGLFDIEVIGPRMSADGTEAGLRRCVNKLRSLLESAESSRAS